MLLTYSLIIIFEKEMKLLKKVFQESLTEEVHQRFLLSVKSDENRFQPEIRSRVGIKINRRNLAIEIKAKELKDQIANNQKFNKEFDPRFDTVHLLFLALSTIRTSGSSDGAQQA